MSLDFVGFTYNGKHSFYDLGIYRTSNGSRYSENLAPSLTDKTADATGRDGQYYFYTTAKTQTFSVSYAFDQLTENGLRKLKQVFNGRAIHDLVFDEAPYKTWSAKVTGNSQVKHLCFTDKNGDRVYRGDGTLTFTCYWPYARTSDISALIGQTPKASIPAITPIECNLFTQAGEQYKLINTLGSVITIHYSKLVDEKWGEEITEKINVGQEKVFSTPVWIKSLSVAAIAQPSQYLTLAGDHLYYTTGKTFEYFGNSPDGRNINHYPASILTNKREWAPCSGLFATPKLGENFGDLPTTFEYSRSGEIPANTTITLGNIGEITVKDACSDLHWDSKTGLVTGVIKKDTKVNGIRKPVAYLGNSVVEIPVGNNLISVSNDETLKYNYWYY